MIKHINENTGEVNEFNSILDLNDFVVRECINEPYTVIDMHGKEIHNDNGRWLLD